jgi:hypothetical protein
VNQTREGPPREGSADGPDEGVCFGGEHPPDKAPAQTNQAEIIAFPHRRARRTRPRQRPPRRIEVRLTAIAGLYPYGGVTRSFELTQADLDELIAIALRLEERA